ncbi:MAG: M56 family metallopeptidase, partial [Bacteroidota bacterium]
MPLSKADRDHILNHEAVHIRQKHTADVLVMEFFQVVFWFNPLVHLIKRRLGETHEYLADAEVIKNANSLAYGKLLAKQVLYQMDLSLGSHFNKSQVFKRLEMLKLKSYETSNRRFRLLFPLIAIMLGVFSCEKTDAWITEDFPNTLMEPKAELGRLDIFILQDEVNTEGLEEYVEIHETRLRARVGDLTVEIEGIENEVDRQRAMEFLADLRKEVEITATPTSSDEAVPMKTNLDQAPSIRGGQTALGQLMGAEMSYPIEAKELRLEGKIYVGFLLTEDGEVQNAVIEKSIDVRPQEAAARAEMEKEALRGIKATSGY